MEATPSVTRTGRGEDVEAGDPESEHQHQLQQSSSQSSPSRADKAVSTGDLGIGTAMLGAPLGDLLAALVETKACAIKAECERVNRRTSRAWRLLRLHRKEPQAQARVTPVVHHHHGHHHHHHHHHPLHHHHHHHHQQQPPITLHGSALSPTDGLVGACSPLEPCPLGARGPLSPPGGPTSACSSDLVACTLPPPLDVTVTGMCTTSDAPGLPSDTTLSPPHPDADSDSDHQHALPPLPLDPPPSRPHPRSRRVPPPLRRTLSSRSHQYHNYDYSTAQVTSWSCSATPQGTPVGTPVAGTPLATPAGSAAPSRAPSPPTPPDPENHLHLLYHPRPADPPPDPPPEHDRPRPRRKKRRRRKAAAGAGGGGPGAAGARRGGAKGAKQHGGGGVKGGKRPPIRGPLAEDVRPRPLDPDELPKRARWTIAVTAGFLLILSMLLVGITLRMAPLIDEMVRQQNEEHRNMLNSSHALPAQNSSHRS